MIRCEHCQDRLLDYVYGLLDESELQEVREHLDGCADCPALLEATQTQQKLLARAAKAVTVVAPFTLPADAPAQAPEVMPIASQAAPKRSAWRRPWVAWTVAASVLIAFSAAISYHRHGVQSRNDILAEKRLEHKKVAEQFASLAPKYEALHHAALQEHRAQAGPYLHILGPSTLQAGAKAHLHITTRNIEGTPAQSNLRIKLVEAATGKVVQVMRLQCERDGQAVAELDASSAAPNSELKLLVEADTGSGATRLEETLKVQAPTYVTRIDTNKIAYQLQDVLFFRVLVLDRHGLQPPTQPIPMRVELIDPSGKAVRTLDVATDEAGVLAREFAIDDRFLAGNYTLSARPIDPAKLTVQTATQRLEIARELRLPDIQFDKDNYLPGEEITGWYRGPAALAEGAMIDQIPVPLTLQPQLRSFAPGAGGLAPKAEPSKAKMNAVASAADTLHRFSVPQPANLPAAQTRVLTLPLHSANKKKAELRTNIPLAPTEFAIDFFPEGGDLIAGVQNRVFYRVRSKSGEPVTSDGQVILLTSKNDIVDSSYQLGMGFLDFVPHGKETYTVRITTPAKTENIADPFVKLGVRTEGVVVHVPRAVGNQGDSIRMTLRQQGPTRKLLLVAQCRGQIIDQRWVEVRNESVDLTLQPTQEVSGMIRVTAYQLKDTAGSLVPVAERLVYRAATQRLDLGFTLNTQRLVPGPVSAKATARDEKGHPAAAWLCASVVDERFQARPRSLSAHFMLLNEVRTGPDLDNAQIILHDSPESAPMLERFLGTHGWRRFVSAQEPSLGVQKGEASVGTQPQVFSRENIPLADMQRQYEDNLAKAVAPIRTSGFREKQELEDERDRLAGAASLAAEELVYFEALPQLLLRIGLGTLVAILFTVSLVMMAVGVYRLARAHKIATPAFGSAFACLVVCLGIYFAGQKLGDIEIAIPVSIAGAHGPGGREVESKLNQAFAQVPAVRHLAEQTTTGAFALRSSKKTDQAITLAKVEEKNDWQWSKDANLAFARREVLALDGANHEEQKASNFAMKKRFETARSTGDSAAKGGTSPLPPNIPKGIAPSPLLVATEPAGKAVEYFHQHVPNLQADTLLWHPALSLVNGTADVRFDIGSGNTTYRVLLLGHSPTGRFGFYETRLDVIGR